MLSVLTVNIGAASPDRARQLLAWLAGRPEDVFILTETSAGPGTTYLLDQFRHAGYAVAKTPDTDGERGAALVSRVPFHRNLAANLSGVTIPGRVTAAVLDSQPAVTVLGIYVPSRDRSLSKTERKQQFIQSLIRAYDTLPAALTQHLVLGGDYNVIARTHQPQHPGFLPFEFGLLEDLRTRGFTDAHDLLCPGAQPHSWIGRTGDGYRYDYLHVSRELTGRVAACAYLHETRERNLTDHAALTMTLRAGTARIDTSDPVTVSETNELTLF